MDLVKAAQIAGLMVSPTIFVGVLLHAPRLLRATRGLIPLGTTEDALTTNTPPIEELAADLRRLLLRHESLRRSQAEAMRARRLAALEAAITDCAADAARALGVACPQMPARGGLPTPQLRRLLQALMDAGLVLPPWVDLLSARRRGPDPGVAAS